MSEEQLTALLAKLKEDAGLQEKLKAAADLDAAVAMAQEAGFDVNKADWLRYQVKETLEHQEVETLELTDAELEEVAGGMVIGGNGQLVGRGDEGNYGLNGKSWIGVCLMR